MAVINELFEEAATRALELARQVDEAKASLEAVAGDAAQAADKVRGEGGDAHRELQELGAALQSAEAHLQSAVEAARGDLDGLRSRAGEVRDRVAQMLDNVARAAAELEAEKASLSGQLAQHLEEAVAGSEQAVQRLAQVQATAEKQLEAASAAVGELREASAAASQAAADGQRQVMEALDDLEAAAREQARAYVATLDGGLDSTASLRVDLGNQLLREHNEAVVAVRQGLTEEAAEATAAALEPLRSAIQALGALCAQGTEALPGRAAEVLDRVREAQQAAERLRPVLSQSSRLAQAQGQA
jgi:chromosome segregation ATPase